MVNFASLTCINFYGIADTGRFGPISRRQSQITSNRICPPTTPCTTSYRWDTGSAYRLAGQMQLGCAITLTDDRTACRCLTSTASGCLSRFHYPEIARRYGGLEKSNSYSGVCQVHAHLWRSPVFKYASRSSPIYETRGNEGRTPIGGARHTFRLCKSICKRSIAYDFKCTVTP